ncbi:hypothetical protein JW960_28360 [candidate division KSB1 bacterium]|nr:hypothetical protein [candidate division KSB1 bacterium]
MKCSILFTFLFLSLIVVSDTWAQYIQKVVKGYVIIDTDHGIGKMNDFVQVRRQVGVRVVDVGIVKLVKMANGRTAAKIIKQIRPIRPGDFVYIEYDPFNRSNFFHGDPYFPKTSIGLSWRSSTYIGENSANFSEPTAAGFFVQRRIKSYFSLQFSFFYHSVHWERDTGFPLSRGVVFLNQYVEAKAYAGTISPNLLIPLAGNHIELMIGPAIGYATYPARVIISAIPYNTGNDTPASIDVQPPIQSGFWLGVDAGIRINIFNWFGVHTGVSWEKPDMLKGFTESDVSSLLSLPFSIAELTGPVGTQTVSINVGIVFNF